jgi:hypothetical protein
MSNKAVATFTFVVALLALQSGWAQIPADQVYIGSTTTRELNYSGATPLNGVVTVTCVATNGRLGGAAGAVTRSTTKGNRGGGLCPSAFAVTGSVQLGDGPQVRCEGKSVDRPPNGWNSGNTPIHHAFYDSVDVNNNLMGAD